jgi:hypothetical protein
MTIRTFSESAASAILSPVTARELSQLTTLREFLLAFLTLYFADTQGLDTFRDWQAACL